MTHREELSVKAVIDRGRKAWKAIRRDSLFDDWLTVGRALLIGRHEAMNEAGKNVPQGKGYATAFGKWLRLNGFADMDKSDRARLMNIMDNEPDVIAWRNTLTLTERLRLNHPTNVWRRFEAANRPRPSTRPGQKMPPSIEDLMNPEQKQHHDEQLERMREILEENLMGPDAESNARSILRQINALGLPPAETEALVAATIEALQRQG